LNGIASFDALDTNTVVTGIPEPASFALTGFVLLAGGCKLGYQFGYKLKKRSN
jgi:hypothetical protein